MAHRPYLEIPGNLCFSLNIDLFNNPFDDTPCLAGAMHLAVLNLPCCEQYKIENIILVTKTKEPKHHNNSYLLSPLVADMCKLYDGHIFNFPFECYKSILEEVNPEKQMFLKYLDFIKESQ